MDRSKKLSETEYEIMEVLWNSEVPMSASQILSYFAEHRNKEWKAQTLATFLSRLTQKGLLTSKREGLCLIIGRLKHARSTRKAMHNGF